MIRKILIVKSDTYSASALKDLLTAHHNVFDCTLVDNRKEATTALQQQAYTQVVTALKIPRISDGYVLLSQLADKHIQSNNIIVIVDEKTDSVVASINSRGVEHIFPAKNLDGVVKILVATAGAAPSGHKKNQADIADVTYDLEKVKSVLNYVMGPVGNMIFADVIVRWHDHNNLNELLELIKTEINDPEKIALFQSHLD
ncbi:hypothetical protein [Desulfopila sp. IMCC35006]|uniref:hypothetical protein n=1 Tax=Desulfopila sp. IMCC35006 TaxID=2569542 RepID=UPI00142EAAB5|nr:hypothetical protein [Desulfopila sp. IMCC35006]